MSLGRGIAIAGIWVGVGLSAHGTGLGSIAIAFMGFLGTLAIAE